MRDSNTTYKNKYSVLLMKFFQRFSEPLMITTELKILTLFAIKQFPATNNNL